MLATVEGFGHGVVAWRECQPRGGSRSLVPNRVAADAVTGHNKPPLWNGRAGGWLPSVPRPTISDTMNAQRSGRPPPTACRHTTADGRRRRPTPRDSPASSYCVSCTACPRGQGAGDAGAVPRRAKRLPYSARRNRCPPRIRHGRPARHAVHTEPDATKRYPARPQRPTPLNLGPVGLLQPCRMDLARRHLPRKLWCRQRAGQFRQRSRPTSTVHRPPAAFPS